jgi:hypothetical protein
MHMHARTRSHTHVMCDATVDDSTIISWESVYKISYSWVDMLMFYVLFYLESCIWPDVIL